MAIDEKDPELLLGSELRDAIARILTRVQPNIKFKELTRLVTEFEIELDNLVEIEKGSK